MASSINASTSGPGGVITTADNSGILNLQSGGTTVATVNSAGMTTVGTVNVPNTFGFKNRLINGAMNLWQRGTSVTASSAVTWLADRWSGCQFANQTLSQSSSVPTGFQYSLKAQRPNGNTGTGLINIAQSVEYQNMYDLAGQTVTFSFWALAGANFSASGSSLGVQIQTGTTADQGTAYPYYSWTGVTQPVNSFATISTTWTKYTFTATIPSNAKELIVVLYYTPVGTAGADDAFYVTGVQLELGSQATSFDFRSIGTELLLCQRYYYASANGAFVNDGQFTYLNSSNLAGAYKFGTTMRAQPTITVYNGSTANQVLVAGSSTTSSVSGTNLISQSGFGGIQGSFTNSPFPFSGFNITASAEL